MDAKTALEISKGLNTQATTTDVSGVPSWTPEESQLIDIYQQKQGMSRSEAIRKLTTAKKKGRTLDFGINTKLTGKPQPAAKPARTRKPKAAKAPKAKAAKRGKESKYSLTPAQQRKGDEAMNKVRGKGAVERKLKSSLNPKYAVYQFWGLSDGNVCHINYGEEVTAHLMPEKSSTVKNWRRLQARELKRAEAKLAKAAKKAEAK